MNKSFRVWSVLALAGLFGVGTASTLPAQTTQPSTTSSSTASAAPTDNDTNRRELRNFDRFLDNHPEVAEQIRKDPSLVNNEDFLEKHPQLQQFLKNHPGVQEELKENPQAFMNRERRFDRREGNQKRDINRRELTNFDRYLDNHPEVAEQLRKDPSLVNNEDWMEKHPELQEFMKNHPGVREELKENPQAFMNREARFEKQGGDVNRQELRNFDRYLDNHPEVAQQLRKDPSLINNEDWMEKHPELQEFMKNHPGVREELKEHPRAFMKREGRYERHENEGSMRPARAEKKR